MDSENKEKYGYIYITENLINGKKYIGQSKYKDKEYKNKNYLGSGILIVEAIKKYGKENFSKTIIDEAYSKEELNEKEQYWIKYYNAVEDPNFYNILKGGICGLGRSLGSKYTEEEKQRMSQSKIGNSFKRGKKESLEACKKKSVLKMGNKIHLNYGLKVKCIETQTIYHNAEEVERKTGIGSREVRKVCRGLAHTAGGFTWEFLDPSKDILVKDKIFYCIELNKIFTKEMMFQSGYLLDTVRHCIKGHTETAYGFHWKYITEEEAINLNNNQLAK